VASGDVSTIAAVPPRASAIGSARVRVRSGKLKQQRMAAVATRIEFLDAEVAKLAAEGYMVDVDRFWGSAATSNGPCARSSQGSSRTG
jgi:hypothetical protein